MTTLRRPRQLARWAFLSTASLAVALTGCTAAPPVGRGADISSTSSTIPVVKPQHMKYVSPTGQDNGPGTADSPWKTIDFALTHTIKGDVLYVHGGTYRELVEKPHLHIGTETRPIYVTNVPGERPVLEGAISLTRPEYWNFSGLNVTWDPSLTNPPSFMVKITGGIGWSWRDSEFSGSLGAGNMFVGYAAVVIRNHVTRFDPKQWTLAGNCFHDLRPAATSGHAANLVLGAMKHPRLGTVERNIFFNNQGQDNITLGSASGSPRKVLLRYNTIYGGRFAMTLAGAPRQIQVTRNLIGGANSEVLVRFDNSYAKGTRFFQNLAVDAARLLRPRADRAVGGAGNVLLEGAGPAGQTPTASPTSTSSTTPPLPPIFSRSEGCDGFRTTLPEAIPYGRYGL